MVFCTERLLDTRLYLIIRIELAIDYPTNCHPPSINEDRQVKFSNKVYDTYNIIKRIYPSVQKLTPNKGEADARRKEIASLCNSGVYALVIKGPMAPDIESKHDQTELPGLVCCCRIHADWLKSKKLLVICIERKHHISIILASKGS